MFIDIEILYNREIKMSQAQELGEQKSSNQEQRG